MKLNQHTKLVKDVITNDIDFTKKEENHIKSFKQNLIITFLKSNEEKEILRRTRNI